MSLVHRRCWLLLSCLLLSLAPLQAQVGPRVEKIEIRHVGPPAASDELVKANIRVKVGDSYSRTGVDDDVRNLYATGYFYNIRVVQEPTDAGVNLVYVVQGNPVLTDIRFSGNKKYGERKLRKKVTSKLREPVVERKLFADSQEIQKLYQKAGYQRTQVKYVLNIDENAGRATATFEITESPKVKIKDVQFEGAAAFKQSKLRKTIKTRRRWMFSWLTGSGVLKDEQFEEDKDKLAALYHEDGYVDFELKDVQFDQVKPNRMILRLSVYEGTKYKVGAVEFKENKLFGTNDYGNYRRIFSDPKRPLTDQVRGLKSHVGATFTPKNLARDIGFLHDFYGARGYIDSQVRATKVPNTEKGTMDLTFVIEEGQKSYIEKIEIKGNVRTKDRVIRRELAVAPGETFDMVRVELSKLRLDGLNYFEKVDAEVEPTDAPDRKNLIVGVEEKGTGEFELGAGFSSIDQLVGFVGYREGNFDLFKPPTFKGGGQKFRIRASIGTRRQDYQLSFVEPWFTGRKLALGVDLYHRELRYLSDLYDQSQSGVRLSLTRALWSDFLIGSASYTIENIGIDFAPSLLQGQRVVETGPGRGETVIITPPRVSQVLAEEAGDRLVSKVGLSLAYDTRNSSFLPSRGQRTRLMGEFAGGPLGADTDIYKIELQSSRYIRGFYPGHILELVGQVGVVDTHGGADRVPIFDRFFLGGVYSLRGYKFHGIGPRDEFGEPLGGRTFWSGSAEYSIPIIPTATKGNLRFAVFYDIGMVYQDAYSFSETTHRTGFYNDDWGIGVRLNIPRLGPLRLDYAFPLTHDSYSGSGGKFQFGVGFTREY
ncbi:MAG: outer membrane protein assembly factor BamA [Verrucomicrobia bacterium]|nr:outer membrane protein assembly factor BamA [Verrucomicrobiota bacterium]